jgi:hypothetical protein
VGTAGLGSGRANVIRPGPQARGAWPSYRKIDLRLRRPCEENRWPWPWEKADDIGPFGGGGGPLIPDAHPYAKRNRELDVIDQQRRRKAISAWAMIRMRSRCAIEASFRSGCKAREMQAPLEQKGAGLAINHESPSDDGQMGSRLASTGAWRATRTNGVAEGGSDSLLKDSKASG